MFALLIQLHHHHCWWGLGQLGLWNKEGGFGKNKCFPSEVEKLRPCFFLQYFTNKQESRQNKLAKVDADWDRFSQLQMSIERWPNENLKVWKCAEPNGYLTQRDKCCARELKKKTRTRVSTYILYDVLKALIIMITSLLDGVCPFVLCFQVQDISHKNWIAWKVSQLSVTALSEKKTCSVKSLRRSSSTELLGSSFCH